MGKVTIEFEDLERLMNWAGDKKNEHTEGGFAIIDKKGVFDSLERAKEELDKFEACCKQDLKIVKIVE